MPQALADNGSALTTVELQGTLEERACGQPTEVGNGPEMMKEDEEK
jgi:hypothetical protein